MLKTFFLSLLFCCIANSLTAQFFEGVITARISKDYPRPTAVGDMPSFANTSSWDNTKDTFIICQDTLIWIRTNNLGDAEHSVQIGEDIFRLGENGAVDTSHYFYGPLERKNCIMYDEGPTMLGYNTLDFFCANNGAFITGHYWFAEELKFPSSTELPLHFNQIFSDKGMLLQYESGGANYRLKSIDQSDCDCAMALKKLGWE